MKKTPLLRKIKQLTRGRDVQMEKPKDITRWFAVIAVFLMTVLLTTPVIWQKRLPKTAGEEIEEPIIAEVDFSYIPLGAEEEYEERKERETVRVFQYNSEMVENKKSALSNTLEMGRQWAQDNFSTQQAKEFFKNRNNDIGGWSNEELENLGKLLKDERFRQYAPIVLDDVYLNDLIVIKRDRLRYDIFQNFREVISSTRPPVSNARTVDYPEEVEIRLRNAIRDRFDNLIAEKANIEENVDVAETRLGNVAERFFMNFLEPNFYFDAEATELNEQNFPPLQPTEVVAGTVLAPQELENAGQSTRDSFSNFPYPISEEEARILGSYAKTMNQKNLMKFMAQVFFVLITFSIVSFFVVKFSRELPFTANTVWLLGLPILLALGLGRFILFIGDGTPYAGYAFPAGVIGILGMMLLDVRIAIILVTWGCLLFGLETDLDYEYVIVGLFGGYTAVAALYNIKERRDVLIAGAAIGFVNAASIFIINFINESQSIDLLSAAAVGALSGVLSSLISFAVLPVFEVLFNITTDLRLLELSGLQHPLLKRMEEEAPGTLQHTLNVSKLAEAAAQQIGVNYLLIRAGVYFHDIGKMAKPEYFTENQLTAEDKRRHNELRPQMSTLIIRNHVKEGLEMADDYKLPRVIKQFISEHHGTTLIKYFYMKAIESYEDGKIKEPINELDYRYPGPKPQTIESAVVMLADTVEAIATAKLSGREVREDDIQKLVRDAIFDKFNDGQFTECNLTMRDLDIIRESFIKTLRSRFHSRIDYPSQKKNQPEKKRTKDEETESVAITRDSSASKEKNQKTRDKNDSQVKESQSKDSQTKESRETTTAGS